MSEFPRGWTLTVVGTTLTVAAVTGVIHVLDSFEVDVYNSTAAAVLQNLTLTSSDGVFASFPLAFVAADATAGTSDSGSGLDLAAGPGASMTVALSGAFSNNFIRIQGHDV